MMGGGCVVRNVTGDAAVASFEVSVRGVGGVVAAGYEEESAACRK